MLRRLLGPLLIVVLALTGAVAGLAWELSSLAPCSDEMVGFAHSCIDTVGRGPAALGAVAGAAAGAAGVAFVRRRGTSAT